MVEQLNEYARKKKLKVEIRKSLIEPFMYGIITSDGLEFESERAEDIAAHLDMMEIAKKANPKDWNHV